MEQKTAQKQNNTNIVNRSLKKEQMQFNEATNGDGTTGHPHAKK